MSGQVSRGSAGEYQADDPAGVARLTGEYQADVPATWRRAWQPAPVFLRGESHGQRSLVSYSPWDHKGSDTSE